MSPPIQHCGNCDSLLPGGCYGTFQDDVKHCCLNPGVKPIEGLPACMLGKDYDDCIEPGTNMSTSLPGVTDVMSVHEPLIRLVEHLVHANQTLFSALELLQNEAETNGCSITPEADQATNAAKELYLHSQLALNHVVRTMSAEVTEDNGFDLAFALTQAIRSPGEPPPIISQEDIRMSQAFLVALRKSGLVLLDVNKLKRGVRI